MLFENSKKSVSVIITSDKSYENVEWVWGYRENDKLGGKDPIVLQSINRDND